MIKNTSECLRVMNLVRKAMDVAKWVNADEGREIGNKLFEELYSCIQEKEELSKVYVRVGVVCAYEVVVESAVCGGVSVAGCVDNRDFVERELADIPSVWLIWDPRVDRASVHPAVLASLFRE